VLAPDGTLEHVGGGADAWLDELGASHESALPTVVHAVVDCARSGGDVVATARARTTGGRWLVVRALLLGDGPEARVGVHFEAARAPDLAPFIVAACGLTERERVVTELIARGHATNEIARRLGITPLTVQDHVKSIFEKSGASSRGELVAQLFVDHTVRRPPAIWDG
jgi:DNA-binding CsgD family transcriptional regulator